MEESKKINLKEFREKGYLQEVNRRLLHPLGLTLEVIVEDDGSERLGGVQDYRDAEDGIYYGLSDADFDWKLKLNFLKKQGFIDEELQRRCEARKKTLGFDIEPI